MVGKYIPSWERGKLREHFKGSFHLLKSIDPDIPRLEMYSADFLTQMHKDTHSKWFIAAASASGKFEIFYMSIRRFVK